jgi:cell division protein FtsI/penicillin-binding protein 2
MVPDADYELVHLLERDAYRYRGFEVGQATRRKVLARDADGLPIARGLLGGVRGPSLREILAEQRGARGGDEADEEAAEAVARTLRADEKSGTSGVEAMFDPELRGRNGWIETTSLDEERSDGSLSAAVDGQDVELTLDFDLQIAAEETLEHPQVPPGASSDGPWLANPVGAIVLLTTDGEVLAAASAPKKDGLPPTPGRDLERSHARERTLTRPVFNPPGSAMKPFVAAYAIDRLGLDPHEEFACTKVEEGFGYQDRYGTMHCHPPGHVKSDLARALSLSCNATFAQIGERFQPEQLLEMAEIFGFGRPTGIRHFPVDGDARRSGLLEQAELPYLPKLPKTLSAAQARMRFANGLSWIEVTPMQLGRAMAGLVTGRLPEIRIVRKVGADIVEKTSKELPISARARETVLRGLDGVVNLPGGTANDKGLERSKLGFSFACKTGTADTKEITRSDGSVSERKEGQRKMRKQTWIVGWFPVEEPKAVLVVLVHDVIESSSTTSAYVAAQFLRSPAVKHFLEGGAPENAAASPENRR